MTATHLVCPHCRKINRIDAGRLPTRAADAKPICGHCKEHLLPGKPIDVDDAMLSRLIANSGVPVLVDFWASWCGPCKMMAPQFTSAAAQHPGVLFVKVNTEQAQQHAGRLGIRSIPTMVLFRDGKEVARQSGALQAAQIGAWLQQTV